MRESKVLVIYTGGTIGMLVGNQGYVPEPYFLTEILRSQNRFHDPFQNSLFSNSSSVEGYRGWKESGSGRSSPRNANYEPVSPTLELESPTLPVRSSRPIGHPENLGAPSIPRTTQPICTQISESLYEAYLPSLVTPPTRVSDKAGPRSIRYAILEWNPLLDSSNIEIADWIRIATEIELNYANFDAFVILHGTDTMAYSSSALSFLLEDLGKSCIVTGAQIPLSALRNDALDNLMGSLILSGSFLIPEVSVYFNHQLFRGNRVSKVSSYDLSAFQSPNFPPLVNVGIDIVVNWSDVIRQTNLRKFKAHKEMNPHVAILRLFPGIDSTTIRAFFLPPVKGVVLETFGAGNAPQRPDLLDSLAEACGRGAVIVAITQCSRGSVSDAYETGRKLQQAGVVPGGDMTPECALAKLSYLLSKTELSVAEVRSLIATPLRGEITRPSAAKVPAQPTIGLNIETIQSVLSHFVRLSGSPSVPKVVVTPNGLESTPQESTAPWSLTAAEAASTESVLLPFLIHLAAARNDTESLKFCMSSALLSTQAEPPTPIEMRHQYGDVAPGLVNSLEPASGRAPLHVAALNGNKEAVNLLLQAGALVHLRDSLSHTALYYAARQGHAEVVDLLVQAGATLGGLDEAYASKQQGPNAKRLWTKASASAKIQ